MMNSYSVLFITPCNSVCSVPSVHSTVMKTALAKIGEHLPRNAQLRIVDEAPGPPLAGLERSNDRVGRLPKMLRGVTIRRVVATADVATRKAEAKMNPA